MFYLDECTFCCCWMKQSTNSNYIQLTEVVLWLQLCPYWFSCLLDMSISDRKVLKYPSILVDLCISPWSSVSSCLTKFWCSVVTIHTHYIYITIIVISSWRFDPFIIMQCPFLNFPSKSSLYVQTVIDKSMNYFSCLELYNVFSIFCCKQEYPTILSTIISLINIWVLRKIICQ